MDRLDYTKGLVQRIKAFERLLERHPEHLERVVLLQIAVPSRTDVKEYKALKEEIDQLVGRINGRFSTADWSPIRYIYGCISQVCLASLDDIRFYLESFHVTNGRPFLCESSHRTIWLPFIVTRPLHWSLRYATG